MVSARKACLQHPDVRAYQSWERDLREHARSGHTRDQYIYEVARFLARSLRRRLRGVTENTIIRYRQTLPTSSERRATSALNDFFQYALEHRLAGVIYNPVYRARQKVAVQQPSLLDLMLATDIPDDEAREVRWIDILVAFGEAPNATRVRIGNRLIRLNLRLRRRLELEFCRRVSGRHPLSDLLRSHVA